MTKEQKYEALLQEAGALTAGETVWRWLPPLIITRADADRALAIAAEAVAAFEKTF